MSARDEILARARERLGRRGSSAATLPPEASAPGGLAGLDAAARVQRFRERLVGSGGVLHDARDEAQAAQQLTRLVGELSLTSIARSDARELARATAGIEGVRWIESTPFPASVAERAPLLAASAGLSTAQLAVAETGTLVLDSSAERHRLCSLVPPIHIALLEAGRVVADLGEALEHFATAGLPPALTLVTGPSRTADIELELVVGVHGPRELHVVLVDPSGPGA